MPSFEMWRGACGQARASGTVSSAWEATSSRASHMASERGGACAAAEGTAGRVMSRGDQPVSVERRAVDVGLSIGLSCRPQSGRPAQQLVEKADAALYAAKDESQAKGRSAQRVRAES